MGLIGKSNRRSRRTASEEASMLTEAPRSEHPRSVIPYVDIFNFSILDLHEDRRGVSAKVGGYQRKSAFCAG